MKTRRLHLIRHAKSSWEHPELADIDRPLNNRGEWACTIMAAAIAEAGCNFSHVFASPARRAQMTIEELSNSLPEQRIRWITDSSLYTFDANEILGWCRELDDELLDVVIVGHNPALTDFCNHVSDVFTENLPTCAYVQLEYSSCNGSWANMDLNTAKLLCLLTPKQIANR